MSLIVPRSDWGARTPTRKPGARTRPPLVIVHHFMGLSHRKHTRTPRQQAQAVQSWHMDGQGWSDAAYAFLIAPQGVVIEMRGFDWDSFGEGTLQGKPNDTRLRAGGEAVPFYRKHCPLRQGRRRPDRIVIPVAWWLGGDQEPPVDQIEAAAAFHRLAEDRFGRSLLVDVHGSHRLKGATFPCPGPHVSALASVHRLGGKPLCVSGYLLEGESSDAHKSRNPQPKPQPQPQPKPQPVVKGSASYGDDLAAARAWVRAEGISDGKRPNDPLARSQYWIMRWREAGKPRVSQDT